MYGYVCLSTGLSQNLFPADPFVDYNPVYPANQSSGSPPEIEMVKMTLRSMDGGGIVMIYCGSDTASLTGRYTI